MRPARRPGGALFVEVDGRDSGDEPLFARRHAPGSPSQASPREPESPQQYTANRRHTMTAASDLSESPSRHRVQPLPSVRRAATFKHDVLQPLAAVQQQQPAAGLLGSAGGPGSPRANTAGAPKSVAEASGLLPGAVRREQSVFHMQRELSGLAASSSAAAATAQLALNAVTVSPQLERMPTPPYRRSNNGAAAAMPQPILKKPRGSILKRPALADEVSDCDTSHEASDGEQESSCSDTIAKLPDPHVQHDQNEEAGPRHATYMLTSRPSTSSRSRRRRLSLLSAASAAVSEHQQARDDQDEEAGPRHATCMLTSRPSTSSRSRRRRVSLLSAASAVISELAASASPAYRTRGVCFVDLHGQDSSDGSSDGEGKGDEEGGGTGGRQEAAHKGALEGVASSAPAGSAAEGVTLQRRPYSHRPVHSALRNAQRSAGRLRGVPDGVTRRISFSPNVEYSPAPQPLDDDETQDGSNTPTPRLAGPAAPEAIDTAGQQPLQDEQSPFAMPLAAASPPARIPTAAPAPAVPPAPQAARKAPPPVVAVGTLNWRLALKRFASRIGLARAPAPDKAAAAAAAVAAEAEAASAVTELSAASHVSHASAPETPAFRTLAHRDSHVVNHERMRKAFAAAWRRDDKDPRGAADSPDSAEGAPKIAVPAVSPPASSPTSPGQQPPHGKERKSLFFRSHSNKVMPPAGRMSSSGLGGSGGSGISAGAAGSVSSTASQSPAAAGGGGTPAPRISASGASSNDAAGPAGAAPVPSATISSGGLAAGSSFGRSNASSGLIAGSSFGRSNAGSGLAAGPSGRTNAGSGLAPVASFGRGGGGGGLGAVASFGRANAGSGGGGGGAGGAEPLEGAPAARVSNSGAQGAGILATGRRISHNGGGAHVRWGLSGDEPHGAGHEAGGGTLPPLRMPRHLVHSASSRDAPGELQKEPFFFAANPELVARE